MDFARVNRRIAAGTHPLTKAFPGLDRDAGFHKLFANNGMRAKVLDTCRIQAVPEDMYMYINDDKGHIVAGLEYIRTAEEWILYLDVMHELVHIKQWFAGRPLWDRRYAYVDRPTEVEAYRFAVRLARGLGIAERDIADYLRVEWVSRKEHERLCRRLGLEVVESHAY